MNDSVYEVVVNYLAQELCIDKATIRPEMRLVEDLHADSATLLVLIMDLESEFDTEVSDDKLLGIKTVSDVARLIEAEKD